LSCCNAFVIIAFGVTVLSQRFGIDVLGGMGSLGKQMKKFFEIPPFLDH